MGMDFILDFWILSTTIISFVTQLCPTLCDPMDCSMPGFPSITNSWSIFKLMSIKSVMSYNYLTQLILTVISFSSCLQSFPASGFFSMSQFLTPGGQMSHTGGNAWQAVRLTEVKFKTKMWIRDLLIVEIMEINIIGFLEYPLKLLLSSFIVKFKSTFDQVFLMLYLKSAREPFKKHHYRGWS